MNDRQATARGWAWSEFGSASLGEARRTARLVAMAAEAVRAPAGRISEVFRTSATRQGAYDFLESVQIAPEAIGAASYEACARRAADEPYVFVPMDGTSL